MRKKNKFSCLIKWFKQSFWRQLQKPEETVISVEKLGFRTMDKQAHWLNAEFHLRGVKTETIEVAEEEGNAGV